MSTLNEQLLATAAKYGGLRELKGDRRNNPQIVQFYKSAGHSWAKCDEIAWCSAFMCHVVREVAGRGSMPAKRRLRARSWLTVEMSGDGHDSPYRIAQPIHEVNDLIPGDITVLWRGKKTGITGHVGLFVRREGSRLVLLGGNQRNSVCFQSYPVSRFLGGVRL